MSTSAQQRDRLETAFSDFRDALAEILTEEAQRSVHDAIERLRNQGGKVEVRTVEVEVVIRTLEVAAGGNDDGEPAKPSSRSPRGSKPAKRAKRAPARRRARKATPSAGGARRGRPDGPVRTALLTIFEQASAKPMTTADVREALDGMGVHTSDDNLHQQLRRLTQSGVTERAGRGLYRAAAAQPDD